MTTIARTLSTPRRAALPDATLPARTLVLLAAEAVALLVLTAGSPLPRSLALAARLLLAL